MRISIGIAAYNEAKNIGKLLDRLQEQKMGPDSLDEIYVIASGCTDGTEGIVREHAKTDKRIKLIVEKEKRGKASAVNLFIKQAKADILVLESADTLPEPETIQSLITPFKDESVGMTGGRPIPTNDPKKFVGFTVQLIWNLHHQLSLKSPKLGEIVAFRNIVDKIPEDSAVDEAAIEAIITKKGYTLAYAPEAIVYNRGPETIADLIKQRRRIYIGHLHLRETQAYAPSTENIGQVIAVLFKNLKFRPRQNIWTVLGVLLDIFIRMMAYFSYYVQKKNPYNWQISESTKVVEKD